MTMARTEGMTTGQGSEKRQWRAPRLRELGNLRDFVQTGHAFGKSGAPADGESDPGGESMTMM
jgi:hypothetical protein